VGGHALEDAYLYSRLQFALTASFHYLFPQLSMGLALVVAALKTRAVFARDSAAGAGADIAARFWGRILGLNFAFGVVTGIPLEFQFGANWAEFTDRAGAIFGVPLGMEGLFAFFLESTFVGLFIFGERRLGPRAHWAAAMGIFLGSWLSGWFIVVAHSWMQHPVGHQIQPDGRIAIGSLSELLGNPWAIWEYAHVMLGSVLTACFVVAGVGAFYRLRGLHEATSRLGLRLAVPLGFAASVLLAFPTGDRQAKSVARHQPVTFAAMEGLFETRRGVEIVLIGQPNMKARRLDNPLYVPKVLSFLTHAAWQAEIRGLDAFPPEDWPTNVPGLYYAYHIMAGLGTLFIAVLTLAALLLPRDRLLRSPRVLWLLLLSSPFPYIANTAGWWTAEFGRQPWLVHGLLRTCDGLSRALSDGNALFSLVGFAGLYLVLGVLFAVLMGREIHRGPAAANAH
jgi:cytochrome d ubiquinol oxidase subunit I